MEVSVLFHQKKVIAIFSMKVCILSGRLWQLLVFCRPARDVCQEQVSQGQREQALLQEEDGGGAGRVHKGGAGGAAAVHREQVRLVVDPSPARARNVGSLLSREAALALGNRSAVFFEQGRHSDCLV